MNPPVETGVGEMIEPLIFVSIASYCDPALPRTLDSCLETARHPASLRFGICLQTDPAAPVDVSRFKNDRRFRFSEHDYRASEGGSWARSISQALWEGEPYVLQVDSHSLFAEGWDASLLRMMRAFPADKPLITFVPPLFFVDDQERIHRHSDGTIRATRVRHWSADMRWAPFFEWGAPTNGPVARQRFVSGGFVFTAGCWTDEVRQDPQHYYWGEEFALSIRSFTHGYDLFAPDEVVVWHMLHQTAPPRRHWEHGDAVIRRKNEIALERLRRLAYGSDAENESLGRYARGSARSLAEFERFAGMDLANKRAHPDTYVGRAPDGVTIHDDDDWKACVPYDDWVKERA